jgi:hypothetical protein
MALNTTKKVEKAEPEQAPKPTTAPAETKAEVPAAPVKTDETGKAINQGDTNTAPTGTPNTPVAPEAPENQEPTEADKAAEANRRAKEEAEARGDDNVEVTVKVKNLCTVALRQHSTGTWVEPGGTAHLLVDGWLNNQVKGGLLDYATASDRTKAEKAHDKRTKKA